MVDVEQWVDNQSPTISQLLPRLAVSYNSGLMGSTRMQTNFPTVFIGGMKQTMKPMKHCSPVLLSIDMHTELMSAHMQVGLTSMTVMGVRVDSPSKSPSPIRQALSMKSMSETSVMASLNSVFFLAMSTPLTGFFGIDFNGDGVWNCRFTRHTMVTNLNNRGLTTCRRRPSTVVQCTRTRTIRHVVAPWLKTAIPSSTKFSYQHARGRVIVRISARDPEGALLAFLFIGVMKISLIPSSRRW